MRQVEPCRTLLASTHTGMAAPRSAVRVWAAVLVLATCLFGSLIGATPALAEPLCTDTWTGPSEGPWLTAADWSEGHVPGSSDVACIPSGKTVDVSSGSNTVGVVQGEGALVVAGGSLEVANALEPSTVKSLTVTGATLDGAATINVTGSLTASADATMSGSGSTVIDSGASGTIASSSGRSLNLEERTLNNAGTLVIGLSAGVQGARHARLLNSGTLTVNGESSGEAHGLLASEGEATLTNTGTVLKSEGTGTTVISFAIANEGSITDGSGKLELTGGGVSGEHHTGSWSASSGAKFVFKAMSGALTFALGANVPMSGAAEIYTTVTAGQIEAPAGTITITAGGYGEYGVLEVNGTEASTIENLSLTKSAPVAEFATLKGSGEVDVTHSLTGYGDGSLDGSGATVIESGATGTIEPGEGHGNVFLEYGTLRNEGTLTVGTASGLSGGHDATLVNTGTLIVNGETRSQNRGLVGESATLTNDGTLKKTEGTGDTPIEWAFENYGPIAEETGAFEIFHRISVYVEESWGGEENPSAPNQEAALCEGSESVNCATGNFSQTQTDLAVGGRGVGLNLTRTYNSQAAADGLHGIFGYGWSSSFSDHLVLEPSKHLATLIQADGSSVAFTEDGGGAFTAPAWTQDTLSGTEGSGYSLTLENQTVYKFAGGTGLLESVTDRNGNATTLSYESGLLKTITDPDSRKLTLSYNAKHLVEKVEDPMGYVVKYTYDEHENLASVTQPNEAGLRWQFKYNAEHEMTEMLDGREGKTVIAYNGSHQVESQTDPMKRKLTFEYSPFHSQTINEATGSKTEEYFSSDGQPVTVIRGYGTSYATTEYSSYDKAGDLLSTTNGDGYTTKYHYDGHGNRISMVDPDGHETKWTYDSTHDVETTTTPDGETTTIKRDSHGNPKVIERPAPSGPQVTSYEYNEHGQPISMTDPLGHVWKYEYNEAGDRTAEIDPEGHKRTWEYNKDSQEIKTVTPRGTEAGGTKEAKYATTTERDPRGLPTKIIAPLKHETTYKYDGDGNVTETTDPEANVTKYIYNADNEQTEVEEPNKTKTKTEYDGAGQVIKQTDGNEHSTKYERNVLEHVTEVVDPLGRKTLKEYDKAGNLVAVKDAEKRTTKYEYDPDNRLVAISYSDEKTPNVKYEYNGDGDRTEMTSSTSTTKYKYDELDRLTETKTEIKGGPEYVAAYEYNLANAQTKIAYPNGKAVTHKYYNNGDLKSVADWLEHTTEFKYDADSDLTAITFPSGTGNEDTYAYNEADAMTEVNMAKGAETLASIMYSRNKDEQVTKATTKGLPGEEKPAFSYDENSRLTKGAGVTYKYDGANNPTTIGSYTYDYDAADELEKSVEKKSTIATYTYNEVGERTKTHPTVGATTTYGYDQAGNLTSVTQPKGEKTPAIEDSYTYDGAGLLTGKTVSGSTNYFAWDLAEPLPLILTDGTNSYVYGPGGLAVEQVANEGGATFYLHHDQQGSTRLLTSSTGAMAETATYDAFGNPVGTPLSKTPLDYDGQYTFGDTGLVYLRARDYDPATAQMLSVDPREMETRAPYTFAADNPLSQGDPSGLTPWSPKVKEAAAKCKWLKVGPTKNSKNNPFYHDPTYYRACLVLLSLPPEVYGTGRGTCANNYNEEAPNCEQVLARARKEYREENAFVEKARGAAEEAYGLYSCYVADGNCPDFGAP